MAVAQQPGVTTTVDSDEVDFDTDDAGNVVIQAKKNGMQKKEMPKIGAKVSMAQEDEDDGELDGEAPQALVGRDKDQRAGADSAAGRLIHHGPLSAARHH